jgi:hypothetical protein
LKLKVDCNCKLCYWEEMHNVVIILKDWLGNKRKKIAGIAPKRKPSVLHRNPSGKDLFYQQYMKGKRVVWSGIIQEVNKLR